MHCLPLACAPCAASACLAGLCSYGVRTDGARGVGEQGRGPSDRLRAGNEEVKICLLARSDSIHRGRGREREREREGRRQDFEVNDRPTCSHSKIRTKDQKGEMEGVAKHCRGRRNFGGLVSCRCMMDLSEPDALELLGVCKSFCLLIWPV